MKYYLLGVLFFGLGVAYSLTNSPLLGKPPTDFGIGKVGCWLMPGLLVAMVSHGLARGTLPARFGIGIPLEQRPILFTIASIFYLSTSCFLFWVARYVPSH